MWGSNLQPPNQESHALPTEPARSPQSMEYILKVLLYFNSSSNLRDNCYIFFLIYRKSGYVYCFSSWEIFPHQFWLICYIKFFLARIYYSWYNHSHSLNWWNGKYWRFTTLKPISKPFLSCPLPLEAKKPNSHFPSYTAIFYILG